MYVQMVYKNCSVSRGSFFIRRESLLVNIGKKLSYEIMMPYDKMPTAIAWLWKMIVVKTETGIWIRIKNSGIWDNEKYKIGHRSRNNLF